MVFFFSVINEAATLFTKQNAGNDSGYPAPVYRHTINGEPECCSFAALPGWAGPAQRHSYALL